MPRLLALIAFVSAGLLVTPAQAQLLPFEVRGGVGMSGVTDPGVELFDPARLRDANVELLYSIPDLNAWVLLGELRPHLGATVSFAGQEHLVYGGLSWTFRAPLLPVFAEASLGGAWQGGATDPVGTPPRFGCAALGRAAGSVGLDILPGASLIGTVSHVTDFGLCGTPNDGRTDAMLRIGIRF